MMKRHGKRTARVCVCMAALLLASGCAVTLRGTADGVWDVTAWAVVGSGKVVKAAAVTTIQVTGAVAKTAIGEGASTAKAAQQAELAIVPGQSIGVLATPRLSIR